MILAPHLAAYLTDWLPRQKGASPKTLATYQYAFKLLVCFAATHHRCQPCELSVEQLDAALIMKFLEHLETERHCCAATRNARLAAIKSLMHFLQHRLPAALEQIRQVLAIPTKRTDQPLVSHLEAPEVAALLQAPDLASSLGVRDRAMLLLGLDLGLRVEELVHLKCQEVQTGDSPQLTVLGKGRRKRCLPLTRRAAKAIGEYLTVRRSAAAPELFLTTRGEPMTPRNFQRRLAAYALQASVRRPSLSQKRVSPHVLRHTCALNVLAATNNLLKVALWLGHASIRTSEVYTRTDPTQKLEVVGALVLPRLRPGKFRAPDPLLAILSPSHLTPRNYANCPSPTRSRLSPRPHTAPSPDVA